MANTFHLSNPASRKNRIFRRSLGSWVLYDNNSWSHCLTRMPRDAVIRATTRLRNQRMLTRTAYRGLWKYGELKSSIVKLMKFPLIERLVFQVERCTMIWFVRSSLLQVLVRCDYECRDNGRENRPAYDALISKFMYIEGSSRIQEAYRDPP